MINRDFLKNDLKISYWGVFKNNNIDILNSSVIQLLIEKKVIILRENVTRWGGNSKDLKIPILYKNSLYELHPKFKNELILLFKLKVKNDVNLLYSFGKINNTLNAFFDNQDKLKYLKTEYARIYQSISYDEHLLLLGKGFRELSYDKYYHLLEEGYRELTYDKYLVSALGTAPSFIKLFLTDSINYKKLTEDHDNNMSKNLLMYDLFSCLLSGNTEVIEQLVFDLIEEFKCLYKKTSLLGFIKDKIKNLDTNHVNPDLNLNNILKDSMYNWLMNKLIEESLIDSNFKILPQKLKGFRELKFASAIGFLIDKNKSVYVKSDYESFLTDSFICKVITSTFKFSHKYKKGLSAASYSGHKLRTFNLYPDDLHLDLLHFIDKPHK
ncbi:hypothetical protein [Mesoflavibacter sp.]|uniref:hypothetical protein n=1 Tax=Mesoflavibacter sp. TaxID=1930902 RepID=UPI00351188FC